MNPVPRKAISSLVAGLVIAVVLASGLGFYIYWARQQVTRLPQRLPEPCPATVVALQNGSVYSLFAVFLGEMSGEQLYVIVINTSPSTPQPPQAGFSNINIYLESLKPEDVAKLTSSPTGFDMLFSQALPSESSYTVSNLTLVSVRQAPFYSQLQHNSYYAVQFLFAASPKATAVHFFRLTAVGAFEILVTDAIGGYVVNRTGFYTSNPADLKQVNGPVVLATPLRQGGVYTIVVRQVVWYQQVVDYQTPYLWLELSTDATSPGFAPATPTTLSNYFTAYTVDVVAVPGRPRGYAYSTVVRGIPVYWACRGFVAPVQR